MFLGGLNDHRSNLSNFYSAMVGCSRPSCTYRFFFGVNISNAVHTTINLIRIIELRHNQTQTNKMLN
uniref:photosystem II cytochrome b559 beta subunit n=1 Tax=Euchiton involucratus TaxID=330692 RepID=UPI0030FF213B